MRYIHKPIEVEAIQFTGDNEYEIAEFMGIPTGMLQMSVNAVLRTDGDYSKDTHLHITTAKSMMTAVCGDYIIKGEKEGDFWVCTPDVFEKSYEADGTEE